MEMAFDDAGNRSRIQLLRRRGVDVWGPERVYVGDEVRLDAIRPGAVIRHAKLSGTSLSIAAGAVIGTTGHADVRDCQIGRNVELGAGLYHEATLLEGVKVRGFAEIRPSTLLEEQAEVAHSVALKNTTFTCCCIAGSLINFCDLFLTGGTSRLDHTEIGSGAIHYNFDPRGDKWGSLIGGIRGLLLRSDSVFVGGSCGLVGPVEIGLGSVIAAGSIVRKDVGENELVATSTRDIRKQGFDRKVYGPLERRFLLTAKLVGTLRALDAWYALVRLPHAREDERLLYQAGRDKVDAQIRERIRRLGKIVTKLARHGADDRSKASRRFLLREHLMLVKQWDAFKQVLEIRPDPGPPPLGFVASYGKARSDGQGHVPAVKSAECYAAEAERWLERLAGQVTRRARSALTE